EVRHDGERVSIEMLRVEGHVRHVTENLDGDVGEVTPGEGRECSRLGRGESRRLGSVDAIAGRVHEEAEPVHVRSVGGCVGRDTVVVDAEIAVRNAHVWFEHNSGWAPPDEDTVAEWTADGVCRCPDECLVTPD